MNVTIIGSGYVGLVSGACLSDVGNNVVCMDSDKNKIEFLKSGGVPIYEPGLEELIKSNKIAGRLSFTSSMEEAIKHAEVLFIAVGTPPDSDGSADLKYVLQVADSIGELLNNYLVIVNKSTVPVGTAKKVEERIQAQLNNRSSTVSFSVVSNPEFLKEGAAIEDFLKPDRIVIGSNEEEPRAIMRELYAPFNRSRDKLIFMDIQSSELCKYAANAMLATKISFMNEMANIAERVGADIETIRLGIGADPRIGYHFIYPGCGFGGSCFPKDVRALSSTAREAGYEPILLESVTNVNNYQKESIVSKILTCFEGSVEGLKFGIWGLSFKPNTDDVREAPSLVVIHELGKRNAEIIAYDPVANEEASKQIDGNVNISFSDNLFDAIRNVDALILLTEWKEFRSPDFMEMTNIMRQKIIFDGRNVFDPESAAKYGFDYYGVGRTPVLGRALKNGMEKE